jgi:hypothetical protein
MITKQRQGAPPKGLHAWGPDILKPLLDQRRVSQADLGRALAARDRERNPVSRNRDEWEEHETRFMNRVQSWVRGLVEHPRGRILADVCEFLNVDPGFFDREPPRNWKHILPASPHASAAGVTLNEWHGDGHRVDVSQATGDAKTFFDKHLTGPNRQAWYLTSDILDAGPCKPGSYLVVETGRSPGFKAVVLAYRGDTPLFRIWVGGSLITASQTFKDEPALVEGRDARVAGVVIACWP